MIELGAVSDPLDAGFASRRSGEPGPSTWSCPTTSSSVAGRMRTASGRVTSSGASVAANRSASSVIAISVLASFELLFEYVSVARQSPTW